MRKLWLVASVAVLASAGGGSAQAAGEKPKAEKAKASVKTAKSETKASFRLDITKWPVFAGAILTQEVNVDAEQLKAMGSEVPAELKPLIGSMQFVNVRGYKLPKSADARKIIGFYEPRILAAGYKVMVKELRESDETGSAVYLGPASGILLIEVAHDGHLEIVSVVGDIKSLSALSKLNILGNGRHAPTATPPSEPRPEETPAPDDEP